MKPEITITIPANLAYALRQACGKYKTSSERAAKNAEGKSKSDGLIKNQRNRYKYASELFDLIDEPTQAQSALIRKEMKCL